MRADVPDNVGLLDGEFVSDKGSVEARDVGHFFCFRDWIHWKQFGLTAIVERDEVVYLKDDAADWCWRVVSGCVRTVELLDDGRRCVSDFLLPGDLLASMIRNPPVCRRGGPVQLLDTTRAMRSKRLLEVDRHSLCG